MPRASPAAWRSASADCCIRSGSFWRPISRAASPAGAGRRPRVARRRTLLAQRFFQLARPRSQPLLVAGETPDGVLARVALRRPPELRRHLLLRVSELPRLELQVADRAAALVGPGRFEIALRFAQPLERAIPGRGRLRRVLPAQIARRAAHFLGRVAHAIAG